MSFYALDLAIEIAVRDYVPENYKKDTQDAQRQLSKYKLPDFNPQFSKLILTENSQQADFITDGGAIGGVGLIVSESVKNIFSNYSIPPHRYYPLETFQKGLISKKKYFWLQFIVTNYSDFDFINFQMSQFYIFNYPFKVQPREKPIELKTKAELIECIDNLGTGINRQAIRFHKLIFNNLFKENPLDLFFLEKLYSYPIISIPLKEDLEKNRVTGLCDFKMVEIYNQ